MSMTICVFTLNRLIQWGVHRTYGNPGDGITCLTAAIAKAEDEGRIDYTQTCHGERLHLWFVGMPNLFRRSESIWLFKV